jgi:serine/threonine protein kinase
VDYAAALEALAVRPILRGPWAVVGRSTREQGWKLHISTIPVEAPSLLEVVLPLLREHSISFKLARDEGVLRQLNEGSLGATQIGKFLTIYPATNRDARDLALMLAHRTAGFSGPVIVTDLRLGDVLYARYGPFSPRILRDRLGHTTPALRLPGGTLVPHEYSIPFAVPRGRVNPFRDLTPYGQDDRTASTGGLFGPGYIILDVVRSNARGSVFLALDARKGSEHVSLRVLKEGRQHCFSDALGRDMRSRLQHQALILEVLRGKLPVPAVDPYFEVAGNGYLPLAHISGFDLDHEIRGALGTLGKAEQRRVLTRLIDLCRIVRALHVEGYVHRDIKPSNFRIDRDGHLYMVDLELAHPLRSSDVPYGTGTPGFMSPQQQGDEPPSFADDVYGVGAVALFLLTGIHPVRLLFANHDVGGRQLAELARARPELMDVVARCLAAAPEERPSLGALEAALAEARSALDEPGIRPRSTSSRAGTRSAAQALLPLASLGLLHDVCLDGETGLWISQVASNDGKGAFIAPDYRLYRSTNRGVAGVVYCLARLARSSSLPAEADERVTDAIDWLLAHYPTSDDQLPGLHFGEAGVAVAVAEAVASGFIERGRWLDKYLDEALHGPLDWPDLTHGAAGQGIAAMCCADTLGEPNLLSAADRCADFLVAHQDEDGGWTTPPGVEGLSGARLTGFAHGVAGIVYFLCEYSARSRSLEARDAAFQGAAWLARQARKTRRGIEWPTREGSDEVWRWWCHGAPGVALAWLKLFERYGDAQHESLAARALGWHPKEVRYSNLSVCHGLSGLGEIYLEAARVLGQREWSTRADRIGRVLTELARPGDRGVVWLVEDGLVPTADLMVGCAGVAHFLQRLSVSDRVSFPLLP